MRWFVEEVQAGRGHQMLLEAASGFAGVVGGNLKVLFKHKLDKALWETFRKTLGQTQ